MNTIRSPGARLLSKTRCRLALWKEEPPFWKNNIEALPNDSPSTDQTPEFQRTPEQAMEADQPGIPGLEPAPLAPDAERPGRRPWIVLLIISFTLHGLVLAFSAVTGVIEMVHGKEIEEIEREAADYLGYPWSFVSAFLIWAVFPLAWLFVTRARPLIGTAWFLGLRHVGRDTLVGLGAALVFLTGFFLIDWAWIFFLGPIPGALPVRWFPFSLNILLTAMASEVFFRGILQRYIGLWGQAAVYGLGFLINGNAYLVFTGFALGMGLGWLRKTTGGIVSSFVASLCVWTVSAAVAL